MELKSYNESNISELQFTPEESFEDIEFKGVDFSLYQLKSISFDHCKFTNCNLANQSLTNVSFKESTFDSCKLLGINWCSAKRLDQLKFLNSKLDFSTFQGLKMKRAEVTNCSVVEVDFSGTDLSFVDFSGSILNGANFEGASLNGTDFRTSRDYFIDTRVTKIKGAKFSYPDVISLITALGAEVD